MLDWLVVVTRLNKRLKIIALVGLTVTVVTRVAMYYSSPARNQQKLGGIKSVSRSDSLDTKMKGLAEEAVLRARKIGVELDFSTASFEKIDIFLDALATANAARPRSADILSSECLMWGAYVGETIRRNHGGGEWSDAPDETGHGTYPLKLKNQTIFPCLWCVQRLQGGPQESIANKYRAVALNDAMEILKTNSPAR